MNTTQTKHESTRIAVGAPTINEIKIAIKHLKLNKASGPDKLPAGFFRNYPNTIANILEPLLIKRYRTPVRYQMTGNKGLLKIFPRRVI